MAYTEDHIALAAEYALGTLDAGERAQVETMMAVDKAFADVVQAWASGSASSTRWSARSSRVRSCGRTSGPSSRGRTLRRIRQRAGSVAPPPPVPEFSSTEAASA